jgi:hypothetical protein
MMATVMRSRAACSTTMKTDARDRSPNGLDGLFKERNIGRIVNKQNNSDDRDRSD